MIIVYILVQSNSRVENRNYTIINSAQDDSTLINTDNKIFESETFNNQNEVTSTKKNFDSISDEQSTKKIDFEIPTYEIVRLESLSGGFNQGKLFVTVDSSISGPTLYELCKSIAKKHSSFTNILICIYSNNEIGTKLAKGQKIDLNMTDAKIAWLAMYSFNDVEGEYYDDNPGQYIGSL